VFPPFTSKDDLHGITFHLESAALEYAFPSQRVVERHSGSLEAAVGRLQNAVARTGIS
jgi:hypothetical protein